MSKDSKPKTELARFMDTYPDATTMALSYTAIFYEHVEELQKETGETNVAWMSQVYMSVRRGARESAINWDKIILEQNIKPCSILDAMPIPLIDRCSIENPQNPELQEFAVLVSRLIHPRHGKPRNYLEIIERLEKPNSLDIILAAASPNAKLAIAESLHDLEQSVKFIDDEDWCFQLALTRGALQVQHAFAVANIRTGMSLGSDNEFLEETAPIFLEMLRSKTETLAVIKYFRKEHKGQKDPISLIRTFKEALSVWSRDNIH